MMLRPDLFSYVHENDVGMSEMEMEVQVQVEVDDVWVWVCVSLGKIFGALRDQCQWISGFYQLLCFKVSFLNLC